MNTQRGDLDVLFVGEHAVWPLDQGLRIRGFNMAAALHGTGVRVGVATIEPPPADAPALLHKLTIPWPNAADDSHFERFMAGWGGPLRAARLRVARHQGSDVRRFAGVIDLADRYRPTAVLGLGQHSPMMLRGLHGWSGIRRVWYAADELVRFQLSCLRREPVAQWLLRLHMTALYAALEWSFVRGLDGAIGVNDAETRLLHRVAGARRVITIRNGVDLEHFQPAPQEQAKPGASLVFWGRMDFEPNIDAVCWFAREVWPALRQRRRDAQWHIVGKKPAEAVRALAQQPGIGVVGDVPDIRPYAHRTAVTILPMRCGGGIKNKLLEAAAMARPMAVSPRATEGLDLGPAPQPVALCRQPQEWIETIERLWRDPAAASELGGRAREWVQRAHSWSAAAERLVQWLETSEEGGAALISGDQPILGEAA